MTAAFEPRNTRTACTAAGAAQRKFGLPVRQAVPPRRFFCGLVFEVK